MRRDLLKAFRAVTVAAAFGSAVVGISQPAGAGVVRVEGSAVVFTAGNNEVNTIEVNPRGAAFDPATGQFVNGFTVSDRTAGLSGGPGCRALQGGVVCDILNPSFVSLDLGDKDDEVSQAAEQDPGDAVAMRVKGGPGNDTLIGGSKGDVLDGEIGDDTLNGSDGNDVLVGGAGIDTINGGNGTDSISAGLGRDVIDTRDGQRDTINCGLNRDEVTADAADTKKRCN